MQSHPLVIPVIVILALSVGTYIGIRVERAGKVTTITQVETPIEGNNLTVVGGRANEQGTNRDSYVLSSGKGGVTSDGRHAPDGNITLSLPSEGEMIRMDKSGFYIKGKLVSDDKEVYVAFLDWLNKAGAR